MCEWEAIRVFGLSSSVFVKQYEAMARQGKVCAIMVFFFLSISISDGNDEIQPMELHHSTVAFLQPCIRARI